MVCQHCLTSVKTALASLDRSVENQHPSSAILLHQSQSGLDQSVKEGCWICLRLQTCLWDHAAYLEEKSVQFSEQDDSSAGLLEQLELFSSERERDEYSVMEFRKLAVNLTARRRNATPSIYVLLSKHDDMLRLEYLGPQHPRYEEVYWLTPANISTSDVSSGQHTIDESTSTIDNSGLWSHWFRTCSEKHNNCREAGHHLPPFTPHRLIEISADYDEESITWRLVCGTAIEDVQYLTLSHCWGSVSHTSLTKKTYSTFLNHNKVSKLPRTFQHALSITFQLGFRYLWIDSLCIMQDDLEDWNVQASMMGQIYRSACCNIAATWARNGNEGCFKMRELREITLDTGTSPPVRYHVVPQNLYYEDILEAPLNSRGWVTQERYLARRQLNFANTQTYWECRELVASEQFPEGIPEHLRNFAPYNQATPPSTKPSLDFTTESDLCGAWAALVDFYSACKFTKSSDKMIALAGLANEMRVATKDTYIAGLWRKDLIKQLCWATDYDVRRTDNRFREPTYMAPSWSWANINAPIMSDQRYYNEHIRFSSCAEIVTVIAQSDHSHGLYDFVACSLTLRGIAIYAQAKLNFTLAKKRFDDDCWELQMDPYDGTECIPVSIMWDETMLDPETNLKQWQSIQEDRNSILLCLFIYVDQDTATGILLRKLHHPVEEVLYVRVGMFFNHDGSLGSFLSENLNSPVDYAAGKDIDLDDPGLEGLVHQITII